MQTTTRNLLVLLLASVGAAVDVASYVQLGHVFTANMTGNTVLLGIALAQLDLLAMTRNGLSLGGYVLGVAVGALIVRRSGNAVWSRTITAALVLEALMLGVALAIWLLGPVPAPDSALQLTLIALLSLAMGLQGAAVQALSITGVTTTYISGTLTNAVIRLIQTVRAKVISHDQAIEQRPWLPLAVWLVYFGAVVMTAALLSLGAWITLGLPTAMITVVIIIAFVRFR